jgi:multidrug efflux system outer membrane protein
MLEHRSMRPLWPALIAAGLAGCAAVGPDYQRPKAALDAGFVNAGAAATNTQAATVDIATFWRGFNDASLSALIDHALAANGDVRIAQARLQEARANLGEVDALALPGAGVTGDVTREVQPISQQPNTSRSGRTRTTYDASFVALWELDLFGRLRRGSEAARALVQAGEAGIGAAQTSVAAEVARNYMELRGLQQRVQVTEAALLNQRESLRITQARLDAGRGTQLDLARANTLVANTEAALPSLQAAIERAVFRLATLTAQSPRALLATLGTAAPLPGLPVTDLSKLPLGTPEQWLLRRPDLIAAERQLAAATARIGVAKSEFYPRISLSGLLGLNAASLGNLANSESARYSLGIGLTWTPFDSGQIRARVAASEARTQASLASYEQAVAAALEETEGAFSSYTHSAERSARLAQAARSAEEATQLARLRYDAGVTDFGVVLDAEREALSSRDQQVQAQVGTATALVAVYRALGGGWAIPAQAIGSAR